MQVSRFFFQLYTVTYHIYGVCVFYHYYYYSFISRFQFIFLHSRLPRELDQFELSSAWRWGRFFSLSPVGRSR